MTYKLSHHPTVLRPSLQAFLVRLAFARDGQEKLAAMHLEFTARNIWEEKP